LSRRGASATETEALLLRSTPFRDADRVVSLFTLQLGRVSAVARNARSSRRRFGGTLEPFVHFRAFLTAGGSDLHVLRSTEPICAFTGIVTDLSRVDAAAAGLVLLRELLPAEQPEPSLFADALRLLTWVEHRGDPLGALRVSFALRLVSALGMTPRFDACGRCGRAAPPGKAGTFDPILGGLVCRACGGAAFSLSASLRAWLMQSCDDWLAAAAAPPGEHDLQAGRRAVSAFVEHHGHPMAARSLFPT